MPGPTRSRSMAFTFLTRTRTLTNWAFPLGYTLGRSNFLVLVLRRANRPKPRVTSGMPASGRRQRPDRSRSHACITGSRKCWIMSITPGLNPSNSYGLLSRRPTVLSSAIPLRYPWRHQRRPFGAAGGVHQRMDGGELARRERRGRPRLRTIGSSCTNPGTNAVDLAGCYLTDTLANRFKYLISTQRPAPHPTPRLPARLGR